MLLGALALVLLVGQLFPVGSSLLPFDVPGFHPLSSLALHLQVDSSAVTRDAYGHPTAIFGLPSTEARMLLLPVDRQRALPDGYVPPDLTWVGGRQIQGRLANPPRTPSDLDKSDLIVKSLGGSDIIVWGMGGDIIVWGMAGDIIVWGNVSVPN